MHLLEDIFKYLFIHFPSCLLYRVPEPIPVLTGWSHGGERDRKERAETGNDMH